MKKGPSEREQVGMLLEEVRDELKRVAEGHTLLDQKIEKEARRLEGRVQTLEQAVLTGFRDVRQDIHELRDQVVRLEKRIEVHEQAHVRA